MTITETTVDIAGREVTIRYAVHGDEITVIEMWKTFNLGVDGRPHWQECDHQLFELLAPYCWSHWDGNNEKYDY